MHRNGGRDPLAEALKATQNLSKAPAAAAAAAAPAAAEDEEEVEDVEVEEEEEEAPPAAAAAAPVAKKRGRPSKASKKQAEYESKYDREDKNAVKINFTEDEAEEEGKESTADGADDDDEPMVLPAFTSKKRVLDKSALDAGAAAAAPAASPKPASKLSQLMDASQRNRPIPHRHKEDRSGQGGGD